MLCKLRTHFRQQLVGYLALFVALGGTTYAAATVGSGDIKDDAVRSRHIKGGGVKNSNLAPNSVGPLKVIDGSLTRSDIDISTLGLSKPVGYSAAAKDQTLGAFTSILGFGGLLLEARCRDVDTDAGSTFSLLDVRASSTVNGAELVTLWHDVKANETPVEAGSPHYTQTYALDASRFALFGSTKATSGMGTILYDSNGTATGGSHVKVDFSSYTQEDGDPNPPGRCSFQGLAVKAP